MNEETRSIGPSLDKYFFDKKVTCPICGDVFSVRAVKTSMLRVVSRDSDSRAVFSEINPLFYDVWLCNRCGFAAPNKHWEEDNLTNAQKALIKDKITPKWNPKNYPPEHTLEIALERYKLALLNAMVRMGLPSETAMICLKMAWILRGTGSDEQEQKYLLQARNDFRKSFGDEDFPIAGMDEPTFMYMVGELSRRVGDFTEATLWFGQVLSNPNAKQNLKERIRDMRELMAEEIKKQPQA
ncbi:MAG: DUF2225 domain-containing protein [Solirubrobacterales bacterium]